MSSTPFPQYNILSTPSSTPLPQYDVVTTIFLSAVSSSKVPYPILPLSSKEKMSGAQKL
jgi:hypothetical protein